MYKFCQNIISLIFSGIIIWLFVMSLFTVCYMDSIEHTYFVGCYSDIVLKAVIFAVILILFIAFAKKPGKVLSEKQEKITEYVLLAVILAISLIWVFTVRAGAVSDQYSVMSAAMGLRNGDYSSFEPGGYASYYSIQSGLVIVHYLMSFICGEYNYLAFQIVSAVFMTLTWKQLYNIAGMMGAKNIWKNAIIVTGICFLPYTFYSSFVYGTVIGFSLAITAIKYELLFIKKEKFIYLFVSGLLIALSVLVKSNYLIFLIGMAAVLVMRAFFMNDKSTYIHMILALLLYVALFLTQSVGARLFIENKTGQKLDNPVATVAWLEMGLQDTGTRGPGWYNEYNYNTYIEANMNTALQSARVKQDLSATVSDMLAHKGDTLKFFAKKTASQWLNPSFQALWTIQQSGSLNKNLPEYITALTGPKGSIIYTRVLSIAGFVFMLGLFMFSLRELVSVFCGENGVSDGALPEDGSIQDGLSELCRFVIEIVFTGGFVFYLFWEAKGQYTVVYMVMLTPLAVEGFAYLSKCCRTFSRRGNPEAESGANHKKQNIVICTVLCICALVTALSFVNVHAKDIIRLDDDTDVFYNGYKAFYTDKSSTGYSGQVRISPVSGEGLVLSNDGETVLCIEDSSSDDKKVTAELISDGSVYRIKISKNRYLNGYMNDERGYNIEAGTRAESDGQFFRIEETGDGTVQIYMVNGYALSYDADDGRVYLSEISGSDSQKWLITN